MTFTTRLVLLATILVQIVGLLIGKPLVQPATVPPPAVPIAAPVQLPEVADQAETPEPPSGIRGPDGTVTVGETAEFEAPADLTAPQWFVVPFGSDLEVAIKRYENDRKIVVPTRTEGHYHVVCAGLRWSGDAKRPEPVLLRTVLTIGSPTPAPPLVSPTVKPPPVKVPADPQLAGLRVLLLYEAQEGCPDAFVLPELSAWLTEHTAKSPDGKQAEWRREDDDVDFAGDYPAWSKLRKAAADANVSGPAAIVCRDGTMSVISPVPKAGRELLSQIQKLAGEP